MRHTGEVTMPIAFSTLGVPGMPLPKVARLAAVTGYQGVELRCAEGEPVAELPPATVRATLADRGIAVVSLAGYVKIAAPGPDAPVIAELARQVDLAAAIGAPYVRVFPGDSGDAARAVARLAAAGPHAETAGVRLLIETHDSHSRGADVARLLRAAGVSGVGAIWDLMHTWLAGETPAETAQALRPWPGYVQVKDIAGPADRTPLPLGRGVLPLGDCLREVPPEVWVSWEYEWLWYQHVPPLPGLLADGRRVIDALR
jgi:sugar phosphate isomerase/epimerase